MTDFRWFTQRTDNLSNILPPGSKNHLQNRKATVTYIIRPHTVGQVKFLGTWWSASCEQNVVLLVGAIVYVVDREDLTLIVKPVS